MAIKLVSVKCPDCGQTLSIEENRTQAFCTYCGAKVKCLKSKRFINDIEKAKAEVSTERIKLILFPIKNAPNPLPTSNTDDCIF